MLKPIDGELATKIYDVLVQECGAHEMGREQFVLWATGDNPGNEYRFGGIFGMAGKVWLESDRIRVSGPNSQELEQVHNPDELTAAVETANRLLSELA